MKFETDPSIDRWVLLHQKECVSHATAGEQFTFIFLPGGIIECQTVKCPICKETFTAYVGPRKEGLK